MPVSTRATRLLRFVAALFTLLTAASSGFGQSGDITPAGCGTCSTCGNAGCAHTITGCCPTPGCCPNDAAIAPEPSTSDPGTSPSPLLDPEVAFAPLQSSLLTSETVAVSPGGYIDNAIPRTRIRLRYDAAFDNNRPDRAEYFYAKCGCFRRLGVDPGAAGPVPGQRVTDNGRIVETSVDYQDVRLQLEYALQDRASLFVELPFRFLDPETNDNTAGFADLNFGFKYALIACPDHYLTFQLRAYVPTGDSTRGLGTDHYSIEPGLLLYRRLSQRVVLIGEFKDWIPLDANDGAVAPNGPNVDFSGNVLQYGVGLGYELYRDCCTGLTITPVVEIVGWTILDGLASSSADGTVANLRIEGAEDTIVNAKYGVRIGFDGSDLASRADSSSLYLGYGHALTDDRWYEDIFRVEYRMNF